VFVHRADVIGTDNRPVLVKGMQVRLAFLPFPSLPFPSLPFPSLPSPSLAALPSRPYRRQHRQHLHQSSVHLSTQAA
jgi:hypothetical protein